MSSRPYTVIPLGNQFGVFMEDTRQGGKMEHIACFFDQSFADDYARIKNDEVDPRTWDKPAYTNGRDHGREIAISQNSQSQKPQDLTDIKANLHSSVALVLSKMRSVCNGSNIVQISHKDLAKKTGLRDGSVAHAVRKLQELGLIMLASPGRTGDPAIYQIADTKPINV